MLTLRDYQRDAVDALMRAPRGILVAPARSGKTVMMAAALARVVRTCVVPRGAGVLWLCNTVEQRGQAMQALARHDDDLCDCTIDVACPGGVDAHNTGVDVLIVDECHHAAAPMWASIIGALGARARIVWGMTATPHREDGRWPDVERLIGPVVHVVGAAQLTDGGHRVDAGVVMHQALRRGCMQRDIDDEAGRRWGAQADGIERWLRRQGLRGDALGDELERRRLRVVYGAAVELGVGACTERNAFVARLLCDCVARGLHVLCLVWSVGQGRMIADLAAGAGLDVPVLHSGMRVRDSGMSRAQHVERLRSGVLRAAIATSLADEGFDAPVIDCLINAAGGRGMSRMPCSLTGARRTSARFVQRSSRALTATASKRYAELHDMWDWHHHMLLAHSVSRRRGYGEMGIGVRVQ